MNGTLGPRNLGDILKETFTILGKNFSRLAAIASTVVVPSAVLYLVVELLLPEHGLTATETIARAFILTPLSIASFVAYIMMNGALIYATSQQYFRQPINIKEAYGLAWQRLSDMFWATVLIFLAIWVISVGIALISLMITMTITSRMEGISTDLMFAVAFSLAVIPVTYLSTRWFFALQSALIEGLSPIKALKNSSALVKNNWWRVLGILLILTIITSAIAIVLFTPVIMYGAIEAKTAPMRWSTGLPPTYIIAAFIWDAIATILCTPTFMIGATLLYFDLRVRKQGYSLDALANELGLTSAPADTGATPV
jgi:hypothetical protein